MTSAPRATLLLQRLGDDPDAAPELLELLYAELRTLARRQMADQPAGHTLQPTALVHEAWMKLVHVDEIEWQNRAQFFALAARSMRSVLIDHARRKATKKRGGDAESDRHRVTLDEMLIVVEQGGVDVIQLDEALEALGEVDADAARVVELRFFAGLSHEDISGVLETSLSTVERRWRLARSFLREKLDDSLPAE